MCAEYFNSATTALLEYGVLSMDRNRPYRGLKIIPGAPVQRPSGSFCLIGS